MASVYDSTGKGMGSPSMTTEQVMGMIRSMSEGKVGPAKPHGKKTDSGEATRKLQELFAAYFADYSKNVDETKKHTAKVLQYLKELDAKRENKKRDKQSKLEGEQTKNIGNLTKHALRKGSLYTHDVRTEAALIDVQKAIQKTDPSAIVKEIRKGLYSIASNMDAGEIKKSIGRETGKKSRVKEAKGSSFSHNHIYEEMLGLNAAMDILSRMKGGINKLEDAFLGMNTFQTMFKGIIKEEVEFTTNIRAAAYEIDGITEKTHGLQRQYEKIGLTVAKTGVDRSTYEKEYLKNVKKGIKEAEKVKKLTTAQLNTERMIGVEAGSLGDNFTEWHESLGMNTGQVEEIGRGMRDVAKFTGVTGTNLTKAVQSSEAFLKNMRNAGTLTAMAAKNIMELSANAQKLGVADAVEPLLKAMTSSTDFYLSASKETQAFLVNAAANVGKIDKLTTGTIMHSKKDMKEMSKGMRMEFERIAGMSMEEFDKLDAESKMRLNIVFKTYTGMEGGQLKRVIKAAEDSSKGYADRLGEINKKLGMNISMEEKKALEEQKRQLQLSASMSVLNELNEAAEGTDNMAEALSRFNDKSGELSEEMSALGITATDSAGRARQAFEKSLENINAQRTAHGKKAVTLDPGRIERALKNKDEFKMLQDHLAGLEQEAGIASKTKAEGPVSEIKQNVMEINDHLRDMTQGGISKLFNSMAGKLALIALTVVSIAATLAIMAAQSFLTYKGLQSAMGRLGLGWGKGGAKAGAKAGAKGGAKAAAGAAAAGGAAAGGKAASKAAAAGASKIKTVGDLWKVQIDGIVSVSKWAGKKITTAFEGITSAVSKGASLVKSGGISAAKGIGSGFRGAKAAVGGLTMAKVGTGLGKGMRGLAQVPNMMAKGAGAVAGGAKAAALGLGKLAAKLNPLGLIITAVIAGVDGLIRAFDAADRAGQIFGKAQEDVTMSEEYAAKSAGLLIGVLDSLTFGILGMIAPLDEWTDALARFFEDNKIFTIILAPIVVTLEVIWGLIKGIGLAIWEILKGIWDGIKNILQPIWDGLKEVFSMIGGMFGATEDKASGLTKAFREFGGVVGLVSKPIKWIGQAIGWIFKQIGALIGWILKVIMKFVAGLTSIFEPVVEVFKAMWEVISDIGGIFSDLWDLIKEPIMEIYNFFSELFGGGGGGFMDGVKQFGKIVGQIGGVILRFLIWPLMIFVKVIGFIVKVVRGVIKMFTSVKEGLQMIKDGFMGLIDGILWPFRWLYDVLVGHSIVPDLVEGIVMWFLKLPIKVLKALGGLIASIAEWIWDTLTTALSDLGDWIWDNIIGGIGDIGSWLWDTIVGGIGNIGSWIWDNIVGGIKNIGTWLWDNLTGVFKRIVNFIIDLIPGAGALLGSEEENKKREAESGPSMLSGGARFLGGLATLDTGKMWGGVKETAKGAWEGTKRVVRNLNPMNWFDEGSTQILNDGVAMLHKGEQVIPAPVAESGGEFPKTLPPSNQQTQLQQNRASSQAMTPGELQQIAENSNQEVTLQQEMRDLLQQLVNQAKQGGGGAAASEGSGSNILSPFVKYWEWYTGHHKQTAAKAMK